LKDQIYPNSFLTWREFDLDERGSKDRDDFLILEWLFFVEVSSCQERRHWQKICKSSRELDENGGEQAEQDGWRQEPTDRSGCVQQPDARRRQDDPEDPDVEVGGGAGEAGRFRHYALRFGEHGNSEGQRSKADGEKRGLMKPNR